MTRIILNLLLAAGLALALFGAAIDYIMPGASPGLNLPQLLIIACGLLIAYSAWRLRRMNFTRRLKAKLGKSLRQAAFITLITLLVLELALTALGAPTYYPTEFAGEKLEQAPWWTCDEMGCRFVHDAIVAACEAGTIRGRGCIVNQQGFGDSDDFTVQGDFDERPRILMLGDSFTLGYSAEVGKSFVETVEANLPDLLVWNAGVGGTGTNQAAATFAGLAPLFQPHLTVLGFYVNDFHDNLFPLDSKLRTALPDGRQEVIRHYALDSDSNPIRLELTAGLLEFARAGKLPIPNELERLVGSTRLGSLLLLMKERIDAIGLPKDPHYARERELTRQYLSQLQRGAAAQDSELLVLVIAFRQDRLPPQPRYQTLLALLHELGIAYLDPSDVIRTPVDFADYPDIHWNSAGHQKVGDLLSACIEAFIGGGDFSGCPHTTLPGGA